MNTPYLSADLGTVNAGDISGVTLTIGTDAYHMDADGNAWWGDAASYAAAVSAGDSAIGADGSVQFAEGEFSGTVAAGATVAATNFTGTRATFANLVEIPNFGTGEDTIISLERRVLGETDPSEGVLYFGFDDGWTGSAKRSVTIINVADGKVLEFAVLDGAGSPTTDYLFDFQGDVELIGLEVTGDLTAGGALIHTGATLGLFGVSPAARPSINASGLPDDATGNKLADLIDALASIGAVDNS